MPVCVFVELHEVSALVNKYHVYAMGVRFERAIHFVVALVFFLLYTKIMPAVETRSSSFECTCVQLCQCVCVCVTYSNETGYLVKIMNACDNLCNCTYHQQQRQQQQQLY